MRKVLTVILILAFIFIQGTPSLTSQDPPLMDCSFYIFGAGIELGVCQSMTSWMVDPYTNRPIYLAYRRAVPQLLQTFFRAGNDMQIANAICSEQSPAWTDYRQYQWEIGQVSKLLVKGIEDKNKVNLAYRNLRSFTWRAQGRVEGLKRVRHLKSTGIRDVWERRETCAEHIFLLGINIGFAHHSMQIASQTPTGRAEDLEIQKRARQAAIKQIRRALWNLDRLSKIRPITGFCIPLYSNKSTLWGGRPPLFDLLDIARGTNLSNNEILALIVSARRKFLNGLAGALPRPGTNLLRPQNREGQRWYQLAIQGQPIRSNAELNDWLARVSKAENRNYAARARNGVIEVISATYGWNCKDFKPWEGKANTVHKNNAKAHIAAQCNGKKKCQYTIYYKNIGDPAYGCEKDYKVKYRCSPNTQTYEIYVEPEAGWGKERESQMKTITLYCE